MRRSQVTHSCALARWITGLLAAFVAAIFLVSFQSPAFAVPPAPVVIADPPSDIDVPWGTLTVLNGINKTAGTELLFNDEPSTTACAVAVPLASSGNWTCTRVIPEIISGSHDYFVVQTVGGEDSAPTGTAYGVGLPLFDVNPMSDVQAGDPIIATGPYDTVLPGVQVTADLVRSIDNVVVQTVPCDSGVTTYSCTFAAQPVVTDGYVVRAAESSSLYPSVPEEIRLAAFLVTPAPIIILPPPPPPPPAPPSPPSSAPSKNQATPALAPLVLPPNVFTPPAVEPPVVETPEDDPPAVDPPADATPKASEVSDSTNKLLTLGIVAMTILTMSGARGLTRAGISRLSGVTAVLVNDEEDGEDEREIELEEREGPGDRSFTWRFPWHQPVDTSSLVWPVAISPRTPLIGRLLADGSELRAIFGSVWVLGPAMGAVLGIAAAVDTSGRAVPPAAWIVIAIIVVASLDALAGAAATLTFAAGILVTGHFWDKALPDCWHALLVVLTLGLVWTSLPLIGSAIRPFRRLGKPGSEYTWDRAADAIIAALLCAWVAQKVIEAMDLFAGVPTPIVEHADAVAWVVLVAIAVRLGIEQVTLAWYPARVRAVDIPGTLPEGTPFADVVGVAVRVAVYGFIGYVFIDLCWQWWVGVALFALPQICGLLQPKLGHSKVVRDLLPKGIVEILVMIVACTLAVRFAVDRTHEDAEAVKLAFIVLAIPPSVLALLRMFASDEKKPRRTWKREILGLAVLIVTVLLALRGWDY